MIGVGLACSFLAGVVAVLLSDWLATRRHQTPPAASVDECEVCGARTPDNVTVGAVTERPELGGGSGITATWCLEHCPAEHRPAA